MDKLRPWHLVATQYSFFRDIKLVWQLTTRYYRGLTNESFNFGKKQVTLKLITVKLKSNNNFKYIFKNEVSV